MTVEQQGEWVMVRKFFALSAATAVAALMSWTAVAQERVVNVYNWSDYIDEFDHRGLHQGDRHQGRLRRLRFQRDPRNQAARRRHAATTSSCRPATSSPARSRPASSRSSTSRSCRTSSTCGTSSRSAPPNTIPATNTPSTTCGARPASATTSTKIKAALGIDKVDSWDVFFDPENARQARRLRRLRARFADRHDPDGACNYLGLDPDSKTSPDDLAKAEEAADDDPALHPQVPFVGIHQRARQRRHLPRRRLVGRRLPGARPRRGSRPGRR